MRMAVVVFSLLAALSVSACSKGTKELKSPCVGTDDSPCGPHRAPSNQPV